MIIYLLHFIFKEKKEKEKQGEAIAKKYESWILDP
jgi:hypothetical protein